MAKKKKASKRDPLAKLFAKLRPTDEELAHLRKVERAGDPEQFALALAKLDRKYKARNLESLGIAKKLINPQASRPVLHEMAEAAEQMAIPSGLGVIGQLTASNKLACDCLIPFQFQRLDVYGSMSGPEQNQVARGMIGAIRWGANE